jgi:glycosyltransferase involved in cell wall biosynthesis
VRILTVGNMYPPHHQGGYELVWRSAVEHLRALGHTARVLTTDHRERTDAPDDPDVHRELRWYWRDFAFPRLRWRERVALENHNAGILERHLAELEPDVVAWWSMGGMSLSLIERVRRAGLPAVAFVHDDWLRYGPKVDGSLRLRGKRVDFDAAATYVFVSETVRSKSPRLTRTAIAHSGIEARFLAAAPEREWSWRLLYVGRLDERKGVATAIAALDELPEATLTIVGTGDARLPPHDRVHLAGARPRAELPRIYADHDAVLFPVLWDEPWGLVPLEAMGIGRPVVATGRGGSGEYLRDGENCLLHPPGDAAALAAAIRRLASEPELRGHLRAGGLQTAPRHTEARFNATVARFLEAAG